MLSALAYTPIVGKPLIFYLGLATIISLFVTATLGFLYHRGLARFPFAWHQRMAYFTLTLAFIHGLLGVLANI